MSLDPVSSNPDHDEVVFENDRVRVFEYTDQPGERTTQHRHPDSAMYTVSSFLRRLVSGGTQREVAMEAGAVGWLPAQEHSGENIRNTRHTLIFVELKGSSADSSATALGPQGR